MQQHIVYEGSRWTTRDVIPRLVTVIQADHGTGFAQVLDERTGEFWLEEIAHIDRRWTRRASSSRLRAVAA
jgi:hypothetical protein